MEKLPTEILELILAQNNLNIFDILQFRTTCSRFKDVVDNSSFVWRKKYCKLLPMFKDNFSDNFSDWYGETKYYHYVKSHVLDLLSSMSAKFYYNTEVCDVELEEWKQLSFEQPMSYKYIILELTVIVNEDIPIKSIEVVPPITSGNLTTKYYASKVLKFLKHMRLSEEWQEFLALPTEHHILEKGATFIAQWCLPNSNVEWSSIATQLDKIADMVKDDLRGINPKHPLFNVPTEELSKWKFKNVPKSQFNAYHCRQVIESVQKVIYEKLGFQGTGADYYDANNSFINKVLENRTGLPISLAIIFESVARRVGIKCDPITFPAYFLLRYCVDGNVSCSYFIDIFNNGDIVDGSACPRDNLENKEHDLPIATLHQVVERMTNNLDFYLRHHNGYRLSLTSVLELSMLLNPKNISTVVELARYYMQHNLDSKSLTEKLLKAYQKSTSNVLESDYPPYVQKVIRMLKDYEAHRKQNDIFLLKQRQPKLRPPEVKFAVGMVMKHLSFDYTCVIYDWDPVCKASSEWQNEMAVNKLRNKHDQPFYNVMVDDHSVRYVAQENLIPTENPSYLISDPNVGKYFSHFFEIMFIPNLEKEKEYPQDGDIRKKYYAKYHFNKVPTFK